MKDQDQKTAAESRRSFLKLAAAAPAAAATAVAAGGASARTAEAAPTSLGMTKTEHVKKYLDSARF